MATPFKDLSNSSCVPGKTPLKASEKKVFNEHVRSAKQFEHEAKETRDVGLVRATRLHLEGALREYRAALDVYPGHERLTRKVARLESQLLEEVAVAARDDHELPASPPASRPYVRRTPRLSSPTTPFKSKLRLFEPGEEACETGGGQRRRSKVLSDKETEEEDEKQTRAMVAAVESGWEFSEVQSAAVLRGGFALPSNFFEKLFPHQRDGVAWAWGLYSGNHGSDSPGGAGGILGDDMGLGANESDVSSGVSLSSDTTGRGRRAVVVAPVSVLATWETEFQKWAPDVRTLQLHLVSRGQRERHIKRIWNKGGVVLTSYGIVAHHPEALGALDRDAARLGTSRTQEWDAVILDEGHKIKNPSTKVAKAMQTIPTHSRFILSGTPIQNNLEELWALFDFVCAGRLLGSSKRFRETLATPIVAARDRDATQEERHQGETARALLQALIGPHLLRRTKRDVEFLHEEGTQDDSAPASPGVAGAGAGVARSNPDPWAAILPSRSRAIGVYKKDLVLWCRLAPLQLRLYRAFLSSSAVREALNKTNSPLAAITVLKNIACHPLLLSGQGQAAEELRWLLPTATQADEEEDGGGIRVASGATSAGGLGHWSWADSFEWLGAGYDGDARALVEASGKLDVLMALLQTFRRENERCLIFSHSKRMLDLLERLLTDPARAMGLDGCLCQPYRFLRIDGTVGGADRAKIVNQFNEDTRWEVCLLTTGVGSLGLTLTGSSRVVVLDPSWNPSVDAQAIDRAYRMGQQRDVISYRLVSCGSVEEKIYRRQIFKDGLSRSVLAPDLVEPGNGDAQEHDRGDSFATAGTGAGGGGTDPRRYLTRKELRDIFSLGETKVSETKERIESTLPRALLDPGRHPSVSIAAHLDELQRPDWNALIAGFTHHDDLFAVVEHMGSEAMEGSTDSGEGSGPLRDEHGGESTAPMPGTKGWRQWVKQAFQNVAAALAGDRESARMEEMEQEQEQEEPTGVRDAGANGRREVSTVRVRSEEISGLGKAQESMESERAIQEWLPWWSGGSVAPVAQRIPQWVQDAAWDALSQGLDARDEGFDSPALDAHLHALAHWLWAVGAAPGRDD